MKLFLAASIALLACFVSAEPNLADGPIPMVFSGTEVGHALKALGIRTGTDVVYVSGKERISVSLSVTANSPEEAIRCIASAAGLVYRKVGKLYVVAPAGGMRQALEPYGTRASFPIGDGDAVALAAQLQDVYPYATIRTAADKIVFLAPAEDIDPARAALADIQSGISSRRAATDVVLISKAVASTVAPLLAGLYPDVKVTPTPGDKAGGAIALSGPAASVQVARVMAEKLDADMGADKTEFKVYNLRYSTATDIVEFLKKAAPNVQAIASPEPYLPKRASFSPLTSTLTAASNSASTGTVGTTPNTTSPASPTVTAETAGDRAKSLVLRGAPADLDAAFRLLAEIDRKPKQVSVEVNVIETSPENDDATGLLYSWSSFNFYEVAKGTLETNAQAVTKAPGLGQFSRIPWNFTAALNAMVTKKEAKILAKPSVRVIDNGQASVFIGDTLRSRIITGGALGGQNVQIQEFPVGIILLISPRVNADGNITMHVNPVISTVTSIDSSNIPQTSSREAETTTIVKDGETVVLGGLIRDEDITTMQEIPVLSKLPFLGDLFKNRSRNHRRSDILVSITTHIIDDEAKP